jgi:hypothetical protein
MGEAGLGGPSELLQNPYNKLWINIYSANGEKIAYDFNSKDKQISEATILGYQIACFGNTHWANFFINVLFDTMDSPILYYPLDNISTDKYCILLFGPMQEDDWDVYSIIALLDCEAYPYRETQDTDGSLIYQYPYDIRLTDIGKMHTIDQKYLGDI